MVDLDLAMCAKLKNSLVTVYVLHRINHIVHLYLLSVVLSTLVK